MLRNKLISLLLKEGFSHKTLSVFDPSTGEETGRGLALSTDGNHRWCYVDPREGTKMVVAEAVMNIACVGAHPLAVVNCLNFGNPEHPEVMWQLSEAVDGMSEACVAFNAPVVGGNVSLYNETNTIDIAPTPVIGVLGMHPALSDPPPTVDLPSDSLLVLLGQEPASNVSMGGSRWAWKLEDVKMAFSLNSILMKPFELHLLSLAQFRN